MNDPRGSLWRKWDLHVHTPESKHYKGTFEDLINQIKTCEADVIGINDYSTLDGYDKIMQEKDFPGKVLFPVVEFRMHNILANRKNPRSGTEINFHLIFDNEEEVLKRAKTFLSSIFCYNAKGKNDLLGSISKDDLPKVTVDYEKVIQKLNDLNLKKNVLVWLPYDEYGGIDGIDPKDNHFKLGLIKNADIMGSSHKKQIDFFLWKDSKYTRAQYEQWFDKPKPCIKGSDAHDANYPIGKLQDKDSSPTTKYCWIKADPTFKGLLQVLNEPEERVFIGDTPQIHLKVQNNTTKYIRSISINKKPEANIEEIWFDNEISLNTNLVAIIGNKGKGKSALTDIVGLLCNTKQHKNLTFLKNFSQSKDNKAKHFQATLTWENDTKISKDLDKSFETTQPELAKYIPQNFLEKICTQIGEIEESDFDRELKKVIFSHVDDAERLGKDQLDELIKYRTSEANEKINILKMELHQINEQIVELEKQTQQEHQSKIENFLSKKNEELEAHEKTKPVEVLKPENDSVKQKQIIDVAKEVDDKKSQIAKFEKSIDHATEEQRKQAALISITSRLIDRLDNFNRLVNTFINQSQDELHRIGLSIEEIAKVNINKKPLEDKHKIFLEAKQKEDRELNPDIDGTLANKKRLAETHLDQLKEKLDEPNRKYQAYKTELKSWEKRKADIIGNENSAGSRDYYKKKYEDLKNVPENLRTKYSERLKKAIEIHTVIVQLVNTYRELYAPVNNFVKSSPLARDKFNLNFDVGIVDNGFEEKFFDYISHSPSGTFCGIEEGSKMMKSLLKRQDFNTEKGIEAFLREIMKYLEYDQRREGNVVKFSVVEQLRKGKTELELYDMIFSLYYLKPRYTLRMGDKELQQLSPGERGTLLLVFYLLVDKEDIPLIIDQPEENLDNQTVYQLLVPCIKEAKQRRQILIVTHNPNLAVVCDAEQIICANLDKKDNYRMQYTSGAIENPLINKAIVDILEGTMPAFDNRDSKYHKQT